jgi:hypothetical protein
MRDQFEARHGVKAILEQIRLETWNLFRNIAKEAEEEKIAADLFHDKLEQAIMNAITSNTERTLTTDLVMSFTRNKFYFIAKILEELARNEDFSDYMSYVSNPQVFAKKWLKAYFDQTIKTKYNQRAETHSRALIQSILDKVAAMSGSLCSTAEMMETFLESIKNHIVVSRQDMAEVSHRRITRVDNFVSNVMVRLELLQTTLSIRFHPGNDESVKWQGAPPYDVAFKILWGCNEVCPLCMEPCANPRSGHWVSDGDECHTTIQHKAHGISGNRWSYNDALLIEPCNHLITTDTNEMISMTEGRPMKDYKRYYPSWDIAPIKGVDSCPYWMRFMYQYRQQLVDYYNATDKELPASWGSITETDALHSLRKFTGEN